MKPLTWMRAVRDSDLPPRLKGQAALIATRADINSQLRPSYDLLAADLGCSRRHAIRVVADLEERGWLMVAGRSNGHGSQSNSYLLITPRGGDTHVTPLVTPMSLGGDTHVTPQGVTPMSPRSVTPNEVSDTHALRPVDNRHLRAVLGGMARQHGLP